MVLALQRRRVLTRTQVLLAVAIVVVIVGYVMWDRGGGEDRAAVSSASTETVRASDETNVADRSAPPEGTRVKWPLLGILIAVLLSTGASVDLLRWLHLRAETIETAGRHPPFDWQRSPDMDPGIFDASRMREAASALAATRSEYVALVDRLSPNDHLATYFELLVRELTGRGVNVHVYSFQGDPRVELARLRAAHPEAKLLIFSDAAGFVDARTGELLPWVRNAERELGWAALLMPAIPQPRKLELLSERFTVERADAEGLLRLARCYATACKVDLQPSDPPLGDSPSLAQVRRALSPSVFRWLTACAVQRTLEWNATAALRRNVWPAPTETAVLELVRLGWFRQGSIPDPIRNELLAILEANAALASSARLTVAQELRRRAADAPRGSYAAEALLVDAVAHELLAGGVGAEVTKELRRVDPALVRRDDDLPHLLAPNRGGAPPSRLSRLRYRGGYAALGPSAVASSVLMVALSALVGGGGAFAELAFPRARPVVEVNETMTPIDTTPTVADTIATTSEPAIDTIATTSEPATDTVTTTSEPPTDTVTTSEPPTDTVTTTEPATDTVTTEKPPIDTGSVGPTATFDPGPPPRPRQCFGQASPLNEYLYVTFTNCGDWPPKRGETVQLTDGSTKVDMQVLRGSDTTAVLRVVDYKANQKTYAAILRVTRLRLNVGRISILLSLGKPPG
jgi:hypothetical protein